MKCPYCNDEMDLDDVEWEVFDSGYDMNGHYIEYRIVCSECKRMVRYFENFAHSDDSVRTLDD